jgi:hypothetical protein
MSQTKPVAKQVKPQSSWKERLKFFFTTLISNDACVEGRKKPWYAPVAVALLSILIATTPTMASFFEQSGGTLLNSPAYGLDNALVDFDEQMADKGAILTIEDNVLVGDPKDVASTAESEFKKLYTGTHEYYGYFYDVKVVSESSGDSSSSVSGSSSAGTSIVTVTQTHCDLIVYYHSGDNTELSTFATTILGDVNNDPNSSWETLTDYSTNTLFLGDEGFLFVKVPTGTSSSISEKFCQWNSSYIQGFSLADLAIKSTHGVAYTAARGTDAYQTETLSAWSELLSDGWSATKIDTAWMWTGITLAIYFGLTLVLGFSIWLMTRGKTNPFSIYSFWDCQKIAYWASLAPALLTLFGFLPFFQSGWALLLFIFLYGMRVMWMSMRSLKPQYQS